MILVYFGTPTDDRVLNVSDPLYLYNIILIVTQQYHNDEVKILAVTANENGE